MRSPALVVLAMGLGGCLAQDPLTTVPPQSGPAPGQWAPPPQSASPDQPAPWAAPAQPAPQPAGATFPFPWPAALPIPAGWPSAPGGIPSSFPSIPGWPSPQQPGPAPQPGVGPDPGQDVAQRCVDDINRYRATKQLAPLRRWAQGEPCASAESADDSQTQKAHGSFGRCQEHGQNACPNWPGPPSAMIDGCLQMMWNEGPGDFPDHGHYLNMASTRFTEVACGTYQMPSGRYWAIQNFR